MTPGVAPVSSREIPGVSDGSAFPDTPRDHLHVTATTRGDRKKFSESCGTVHSGRIPRLFIEGRFFRTVLRGPERYPQEPKDHAAAFACRAFVFLVASDRIELSRQPK
jgi:hypothetical protein